MKQTPLAIVVPINRDDIDKLETYLKSIGDSVAKSKEFTLRDYSNLHYFSFIIVQETLANRSHQPVLVFEGNLDDGIDKFLNELVQRDAEFLRKTYQHCEGFDPKYNDDEILAYLKRHSHKTNTFYVAHPGRSKTDILRESRLRGEIETYLDQEQLGFKSLAAEDIHKKIINKVESNPDFDWTKTPHQPTFFVRNEKIISKLFLPIIILILLSLLLILGLGACGVLAGPVGMVISWIIIGVVLFSLIYILSRERQDKQDQTRWSLDKLSSIQAFEDRKFQNHLTSITYVKAGLIRLKTLELILFVVNLAARIVATQGNLSGIVTIHFARWFILKGTQGEPSRMIFFSNYDGSWENYLGEFIDQASLGLSAIWSNTELDTRRGFPDTQFLGLRGGAREEQLFKAYARNSQITECIWYSSYPDISVKNIGINMRIRDGLFSPGSNSASWLTLF